MEDFSHPVVATKTGISLLLRHQSMSEILFLIHSYFTQKNWSLLKNWVEELIKKKRLRRCRDENLIRYLNTCNRQEAKCMFPFHFHFQLSKDVRTRLEISKCWIPWICCVVVLRSMKVNWSATNVDELVSFTGPVYTSVLSPIGQDGE